ncbi:MAG: DDE-type integrase/transposase/recombinase [Hyphomonadaceae bacterium]|nr:DDE-type integrase/transposase/recombinase [Hyphomonadaceae bacterium]
MAATIAGERVGIWRVVEDDEKGMDMIVLKRRDTGAAARLLRRCCRATGHRHRWATSAWCCARRPTWSWPSTAFWTTARQQFRRRIHI